MPDLTTSLRDYAPEAVSHKGPSRHTMYWLLSWATPIVLVLLWEAASRTGWLSPQALPAPSRVFETAWGLAKTGALFVHLGVSLIRAVTGFAIGGAAGFILGVAVGFSPFAFALFDRTVQMVRSIPFLAMLPLVIVWFGVGEVAKVFLVALAVLFPIYINTVLGIRQIDPKLMELAKVSNLHWFAVVRRIILPGAMPSILTGVRYALAHAWLALVIAETLATQQGIGFLAMDAREFLQTDVIVLTIVIYAVIGVVADGFARLLETRLLGWHPNFAKGVRR
ncbi:ABC transporter permease [Robbsia andropogonis]|uniref:ABC transporter permease n=1 Tax=Robbsia andropogonis TaxID=28092 RepID=A0A0F5K2A6_9BURK|nr:ABC transporter permease [Robbsia andropogonis]